MIAICDSKKVAGEVKVINQRDWEVPFFSDQSIKKLCDRTLCNLRCTECVLTRLKEEYSNNNN